MFREFGESRVKYKFSNLVKACFGEGNGTGGWIACWSPDWFPCNLRREERKRDRPHRDNFCLSDLEIG